MDCRGASAYTMEELNEYARLTDLEAVRTDTIANNTRIGLLEEQYDVITGVFSGIEPVLDISSNFLEKFNYIENEVRQVKEVLIDVQMMLRTLGLDDMSKRMGDLDMLLL